MPCVANNWLLFLGLRPALSHVFAHILTLVGITVKAYAVGSRFRRNHVLRDIFNSFHGSGFGGRGSPIRGRPRFTTPSAPGVPFSVLADSNDELAAVALTTTACKRVAPGLGPGAFKPT